MSASNKDIQAEIIDLHSRINPDYQGDLTHSFVRATLAIVRRLKTKLEVIDAEMENENDG